EHIHLHRRGTLADIHSGKPARAPANTGAAVDRLLHDTLQTIHLRENIAREHRTVNHAWLLSENRYNTNIVIAAGFSRAPTAGVRVNSDTGVGVVGIVRGGA